MEKTTEQKAQEFVDAFKDDHNALVYLAQLAAALDDQALELHPEFGQNGMQKYRQKAHAVGLVLAGGSVLDPEESMTNIPKRYDTHKEIEAARAAHYEKGIKVGQEIEAFLKKGYPEHAETLIGEAHERGMDYASMVFEVTDIWSGQTSSNRHGKNSTHKSGGTSRGGGR